MYHPWAICSVLWAMTAYSVFTFISFVGARPIVLFHFPYVCLILVLSITVIHYGTYVDVTEFCPKLPCVDMRLKSAPSPFLFCTLPSNMSHVFCSFHAYLHHFSFIFHYSVVLYAPLSSILHFGVPLYGNASDHVQAHN